MTFKLQPNIFSEFLNKTLVSTPFFVFDRWCIVHLIAGMLLGAFIDKWYVVIGLLILYEIFEVILWGILFRVEPIFNVVFDILIGMLGFGIIFAIKHFFF